MTNHANTARTTGAAARPNQLRRGLTIDHLLIGTVLLLIWTFLSLMPLPPNDLWWHMAAGRVMVDERALIDTNRWAYTLPADAPYVYQSWLSELIFYWLWQAGDVPLLALARTLAITLSYALVTWHALRRAGRAPAVALALILVILVGWNNWTLRPQTLALVPGALFVVVLGEYLAGRLGGRLLALLPLIMALWVNLHGSFVLGAGLLGLSWLGLAIELLRSQGPQREPRMRQLWALSSAGAATGAATMLNPLGVGIFGYVHGMITNSPLQQWFVEWQPPELSTDLLATDFWFFMMLGLLASVLIAGKPRPRPVDLLWFAGMAWLGLNGTRYAMWFALMLLPLLAERLALLLRGRSTLRVSPRATLGAGLVAAGVLIATLPWFTPVRVIAPGAAPLFASSGPHRWLLSAKTPIGASEWLAQHPIEGRFWTNMSYTSYTIWRLPELQVFTDLRVELFPVAIWEEYFAIARGDEQSLQVIDRWQISHLMLDLAADTALHQQLLKTPGWCEPYRDERSAIVARCSVVAQK